MKSKPRIAVIATGGTIDSLGADRLDLAHYTEACSRLSEGDLLASLPEVRRMATVTQIPYRRVPSYDLTASDWMSLACTAQELLDGEYDGVVITHGTNTLEETAFFLDLTIHSSKPVVLVGAFRPYSGLGADGPLNYLRAVQVAASSKARDLGVLVVLNDTVHAARQVTKSSTFRVESFRSPDVGPLGYADADGEVVIYQVPRRANAEVFFSLENLPILPRVDVLLSYVDADGVMIDAAVAAGAQGIVSAGSGAGRPTASEDEALDRAIAEGVVVCQATRTGSGRVPRSPKMARRGVITASNLQPWKARVLLALGLTCSKEHEFLQKLFDRI